MKCFYRIILFKLTVFLSFGFCLVSCSSKNEANEREEYPISTQDLYGKSTMMPNAYVIEEQHFNEQLPKLPVPTLISKRLCEDMLSDYYNATKYGVWVDDKRIENADLINYNVNDFEYYMVSSLEKNASHYGLYKYHVTLLTADGFKKLKAQLRLKMTGEQRL